MRGTSSWSCVSCVNKAEDRANNAVVGVKVGAVHASGVVHVGQVFFPGENQV